jgi:hypothetical protein
MFDDMWDIPRLYVSACSNSCQLVPLQPIMISILFHHYKELTDSIAEVEQIMEGQVNQSKKNEKKSLTVKEEEQEEENPAILNGYLLY